MNKLMLASILFVFTTGLISANIAPMKEIQHHSPLIRGLQNIHFLVLDSQTGERIEKGFVSVIGPFPNYYGGDDIENGDAYVNLWIPFKYTFVFSAPGYEMSSKTFYLNKKEIITWLSKE